MTDDAKLFDKAQLDAVTGGDPSLALEIIQIFLEQTQTWTRLLDPNAPPSAWADGAHAIKGTALSVGAMQLAEYCQVAEKRGRDGDVPLAEAQDLIGSINFSLAQTHEVLAKVLHTAQSDQIRAL